MPSTTKNWSPWRYNAVSQTHTVKIDKCIKISKEDKIMKAWLWWPLETPHIWPQTNCLNPTSPRPVSGGQKNLLPDSFVTSYFFLWILSIPQATWSCNVFFLTMTWTWDFFGVWRYLVVFKGQLSRKMPFFFSFIGLSELTKGTKRGIWGCEMWTLTALFLFLEKEEDKRSHCTPTISCPLWSVLCLWTISSPYTN